jgi:cell division protein FtsN
MNVRLLNPERQVRFSRSRRGATSPALLAVAVGLCIVVGIGAVTSVVLWGIGINQPGGAALQQTSSQNGEQNNVTETLPLNSELAGDETTAPTEPADTSLADPSTSAKVTNAANQDDNQSDDRRDHDQGDNQGDNRRGHNQGDNQGDDRRNYDQSNDQGDDHHNRCHWRCHAQTLSPYSQLWLVVEPVQLDT